MTSTIGIPHPVRDGSLVVAAGAAQPGFFLMEAWLTARSGSWFPTNGAGPDEDVNVYIAHLLTAFARGDAPRDDRPGGLLGRMPDTRLPRRLRADAYRRHGDRLLMHCGLFPRGDGRRRRAVPWGFTDAEARARDVADVGTSYAAAAALLRNDADAALRRVLEKLARHAEDYVGALQVLATRHLGLGARLKDEDLAALTRADEPSAPAAEVDAVLTAAPDGACLDVVLDLVLEHRRSPRAELRRRIVNLARPLGLDADRLLAAAE